MGSFSFTHWIVVLMVALLLFGRGRIPEAMGDFGKGLRAFRKGLAEEEAASPSAGAEAVNQAALPDPSATIAERE